MMSFPCNLWAYKINNENVMRVNIQLQKIHGVVTTVTQNIARDLQQLTFLYLHFVTYKVVFKKLE